jgi:hypothetical protein
MGQKYLIEQGKITSAYFDCSSQNAMIAVVFDLAIYAAKQGRSRAIDRYAQAAQLLHGFDEALMLEAMRRARLKRQFLLPSCVSNLVQDEKEIAF